MACISIVQASIRSLFLTSTRIQHPKMQALFQDASTSLDATSQEELTLSFHCHDTVVSVVAEEAMLLSSRCPIYKSAIGAVGIWGWPLQTAGLFTILSGRVTEWSDGGIGLVVREANSSWVQKRWGVQIDSHTWVLEYRLSSLLENSNLNMMAADFFKHLISKVIRRPKNELWLFLDVETKFHQARATRDFRTPT